MRDRREASWSLEAEYPRFFCDGLHAERLGGAGERLDLGYPGPEIVRATPGREVFKAAEATAARLQVSLERTLGSSSNGRACLPWSVVFSGSK